MCRRPHVAIVDYGMGNLFSVQQACAHAGLDAVLTASPDDVLAADCVILPGVGAFGHAMDCLRQLGMVDALRETAASDRMLVGVCLGLQLLMSSSEEFGCHEGLGIIEGDVVPFESPVDEHGRELKVPQVGWNRIEQGQGGPWAGTPLAEVPDGAYMYFVHSLYVRPADESVVLATSRYGQYRFCSAVMRDNVFACQFHPERSGHEGALVYHAIARRLRARAEGGA